MSHRLRAVAVTGLLTVTAVGVLANTAYALRETTTKYFNGAGPGDESSRWYGYSTYTHYVTQKQCTGNYQAGQTGRAAYDFYREVNYLPDDYVAWRDWSCDDYPYTKTYAPPGNGNYYAKIDSTPLGGVIWSVLDISRVVS
ncbi:hypothetical protein GCM10020367_23820 [Streptomyces sannanensis]|uniref:Uncharacterized protein n=2 Tax=Streptomyces sannanensis TaxID=285536 RepID=A0ABP6S9W2_9ACTN